MEEIDFVIFSLKPQNISSAERIPEKIDASIYEEGITLII